MLLWLLTFVKWKGYKVITPGAIRKRSLGSSKVIFLPKHPGRRGRRGWPASWRPLAGSVEADQRLFSFSGGRPLKPLPDEVHLKGSGAPSAVSRGSDLCIQPSNPGVRFSTLEAAETTREGVVADGYNFWSLCMVAWQCLCESINRHNRHSTVRLWQLVATRNPFLSLREIKVNFEITYSLFISFL